jgi:2-iminoacetate synthase
MEFSVPGFIKRFCQPNALMTMAEYLEDYAPADTKVKGYKLLQEKLDEIEDEAFKTKLSTKIIEIRNGKRDLYF